MAESPAPGAVGMEVIEEKVSILEERLQQDRSRALPVELNQVLDGTHPKFIEQVRKLEKQMQDKIASARLWRDHLLQNVNNQYETEKKQAEVEYEQAKRILRDRMVSSINQKKKDEEEEESVEGDDKNEPTKRTKKRVAFDGSLNVALPARKKNAAPPAIALVLKDTEILEDIYIIRKNSGSVVQQQGKFPAGVFGRERHERLLERTTRGAGRSDMDLEGQNGSLFIHNGKLFCNGVEYSRNSAVMVHSKSQGSYAGVITAINSGEVWIRKNDGQKTKLYLTALQQGKIEIQPQP